MIGFAAVYPIDAEAWVRDHSPILIWLGLVLFALLLVRLIVKRVTRMVALAIVALLALIVFTERTAIRDCTRTCECEVTTGHIHVPFCRPDLDL